MNVTGVAFLLFLAVILPIIVVSLKDDACNGRADMLSNRFAPLYGRPMDDGGQVTEPFWLLVWGIVTKMHVGLEMTTMYNVTVNCFTALPRRSDGRVASFDGDFIRVSTTTLDCFEGPSNNSEAVMLLKTTENRTEAFTLAAMAIQAPNGTTESISNWLAVTNLCPVWKMELHGRNCPNNDPYNKINFNVPPGCFNDISANKLQSNGAASFLSEISRTCAKINSIDSLSTRVRSGTWTVWGRLVAVEPALRQFSFFSYCLMANLDHGPIHTAPRQPMNYTFILPDYDGCFDFDEAAAARNATYVLVVDTNYYVRAATIAAVHQQYRLLVSACDTSSAERMVPIVDDELCRPGLDTNGCYPDISIKTAVNELIAVSPDGCSDKSCTNFTNVYAVAENVLWVTVNAIKQSPHDPTKVVLDIEVNCFMKNWGKRDMSQAIVTIDTNLVAPIVQHREYILALRETALADDGTSEFEVISLPILATKQNWYALCSSCGATNLPYFYPGLSVTPYYYDMCSGGKCYADSKNPYKPPQYCVHQDLQTFACPGGSDSLKVRFNTSTMALFGQVESTRNPHEDADKLAVLFPVEGGSVVRELTKSERELHVALAPFCQITGNSEDLGPIHTVHITYDITDCFNNQALPTLHQGERFVFFIDAQSAKVTATPLEANNYDVIAQILKNSCLISPPEYPAVGISRQVYIDDAALTELCPFVKRERCQADYNVSAITLKYRHSAVKKLSSSSSGSSMEPSSINNVTPQSHLRQLASALFVGVLAIFASFGMIYLVMRRRTQRKLQVTEEYISEEPRLELSPETSNEHLADENTPLVDATNRADYHSSEN